MYSTILAIHNILRWVVLVLALIALVFAYRGWVGRREWTGADRRAGLWFSIAMDVQLLLGLVLYFFLSPITQIFFSNVGDAMGDRQLRFFGLEHLFFMVVAVILVHAGTLTSRRAVQAVNKHRNAAIWFTLAVLALVLGIPWWRPLFPGLG